MTFCGQWSAQNADEHYARVIPLWCRSWTCNDCAPYRVAALKREAADGDPTTFLTLTVNPAKGESPEQRARDLSNAWKIVVKRARRKFPKMKLEYLAVFEETKKGEPHLHILARAPFIPQRWLSEQMNELISAPIVDIRRVGSKAGVKRYVTKYVGKGPKPFATLKRYWSSTGYLVKTAKRELIDSPWGSGWRIIKSAHWYLAECFERRGYDVMREKGGGFTAVLAANRGPP